MNKIDGQLDIRTDWRTDWQIVSHAKKDRQIGRKDDHKKEKEAYFIKLNDSDKDKRTGHTNRHLLI